MVDAGGRGRPPPPPRTSHFYINLNVPADAAESPSGSVTSAVVNSSGSLSQRPKRPPPPKTPELLLQLQKSASPEPSGTGHSAGEYANLGDIRHGMTPKKPERSASLRHISQNTSAAHQVNQFDDSIEFDY